MFGFFKQCTYSFMAVEKYYCHIFSIVSHFLKSETLSCVNAFKRSMHACILIKGNKQQLLQCFVFIWIADLSSIIHVFNSAIILSAEVRLQSLVQNITLYIDPKKKSMHLYGGVRLCSGAAEVARGPAGNDLINWNRWLTTYIMVKVS